MQKQIVFLAQGNNAKFLSPVEDWARERFGVRRPVLALNGLAEELLGRG